VKKSPSLLVLLLFLSLVLVYFPQIETVKAEEETIYIRADGSIEGTDKINRDENIYTFTDNIYGPIVVEKDDVVINGAGYTLNGTGAYHREGIDLSDRNSVTIKNMQICGFEYGIYLQSSSGNTIYGNNIMANGFAGINLAAFTINSVVVGCSFNSIYENNITGNSGEGIQFNTSPENSIHDNNITNNGYDGLYLDRCSYSNAIVRNDIKNNGRDGIMCVIASGGNRISGNNISNNMGNGVTLALNSNVNIISENNILNNNHGIEINNSQYPSNNTIYGNNITSNDVGIGISASSDNRIYYNNFVNNNIQFLADVGIVNNLDNGFEGNYWSDYNGTDSNGDGIGDTTYMINEENQDNYPLMEPTIIPEFTSWTSLVLSLVVVVAITFVFRYKLKKKRRFNEV
jgi:parallel beta-helix repeat protein